MENQKIHTTDPKTPLGQPESGRKNSGVHRRRSKKNRTYLGFLKNHHFEAAAHRAILKCLQVSKSMKKHENQWENMEKHGKIVGNFAKNVNTPETLPDDVSNPLCPSQAVWGARIVIFGR